MTDIELDALRAALRSIVRRYGSGPVERALREIRRAEEHGARPASERKRGAGRSGTHKKADAVDYVSKMDLPPARRPAMTAAAEKFRERRFLPTIGDVRNFWQVHGVDGQPPKSRAAALPRVFRFLSTLEPDRIARMLDDGAFSGPARLGPIADAIRTMSRERFDDGEEPDGASPGRNRRIRDEARGSTASA